ncbi:MAG: thioredoxin family protein [Bacteroidota bacterium]
MSITKLLFLSILFSIAPGWEESFKDAQAKADNSEKHLLIYFSGSDWCANCYRFKQTILEKEDFNAYAEENLILYNADFPRKKKNQLNEEKRSINSDLANRYNKENAFPKVVLIDSEGTLISEFDALSFQSGSSEFIKKIKVGLSKWSFGLNN